MHLSCGLEGISSFNLLHDVFTYVTHLEVACLHVHKKVLTKYFSAADEMHASVEHLYLAGGMSRSYISNDIAFVFLYIASGTV